MVATKNIPELNNISDDKFRTLLYLPIDNKLQRYGEGGLRKKGIYKIKEPNKPLISIVTINLNNDIESTILSVLDQQYENIEFIIKDGGSNRKTLEILKNYDDKIDYWVSEKDNGIWDGTNKGITLATGNYIGQLNSGDLMNRGAIDYILELIYKNPNADCILGSCLKKRLMHNYRPEDIKLHFNIFPSNSGSFYLKKEAFKKIGLYNTKYRCSADYDLVYKMIVRHKIQGICGAKHRILSIKQSGGFSESYSFFQTLFEECRIRFDNNQNIFIILFIFFGRCFKKLINRIIKFDGNKQSKFVNDDITEKEIFNARNYYKLVIRKKKYDQIT